MNPYEQHNHDDIEVELATGWERIAAALLNNIFILLASLPMIGGIIAATISVRDNQMPLGDWETLETSQQMEFIGLILSHTWFLLGLLVLIVFGIVQCYYMSRDGQSIGKKLLNIKVIKENGDKAGFVGVVLLREIVFNLGCAIIIGVLTALFTFGSTLEQILGYLPTLICAVMLFIAKDNRTLQDWIAGTVVIKLPRTRRQPHSIQYTR